VGHCVDLHDRVGGTAARGSESALCRALDREVREARKRAKQRGEPQENLGPDFRVEPRLPVLQPTKFELVIKLVDSFILLPMFG
jgi:hypothetical protein